jgi:threonine dehydratase
VTLTLADVLAARRRLSGRILRTPLRRSAWLSERVGGDVRLKLESLQLTNSFKVRGALNAVLRHANGGLPASPLVTASAGNHGCALAYAAREVGYAATIFAPREAPATKTEAIKALGAELREAANYDEAEREAKRVGASGAASFISAYSHPDVIAGAGTIGVEILEEWPEVDAILVPVGGGGLIAGIAIAARGIAPALEIVGVEAERSPAFSVSLARGRITEIEVGCTIADGLAGNLDPDTITFELVQRLVARVVLVAEGDLLRGIHDLAAHEHLIAEGAGVAAVAAVLSGAARLQARRVAIIVSGGNIDVGLLGEVLRFQS